MSNARLLSLLAMLSLSVPAIAHDPAPTVQDPGIIAAAAKPAAAVVDRFHGLLRRGDTKAALALLADDALIFEGGGVEAGKAEYAAHHLGADAEFSKAVAATRVRRWGRAVGPIAWVATENRMNGSFRGSEIKGRVMTETMVLRRIGGRWRISHIHWSMAD